MSKNWINDGKALPFVNAGTTASGAMVRAGKLRGIADRSGAAGVDNEMHTEGQFNLPKVVGALAAGDLYKADFSDDSAGVHTGDALGADVVAFGIVTRAALSADVDVDVVLTIQASV